MAADANGVSIGNELFSVTVNGTSGHCQLVDERSHVTFETGAPDAPFGYVTVRTGGRSARLPLARCDLEQGLQNAIVATFYPVVNEPGATVRVRLELTPDPRVLKVSYETSSDLEVENVTPLANALAASDSGKGYVVLPVREGLLIPADSGLGFTNRFDTFAYEGCHMEMMGLVQKGAAVLVNWDDPYVAAEIKSTLSPGTGADHQRITASLSLSKSARTFWLHFLGPGDYVSLAKAYREVARQKGLLVTWDQKLKTDPERAKLFGAANIKLWSALDRRMNEESTKEEEVRVNWTFDEAAQVAEHYKKDLQLDRVLFTVGGWIHRGYDNQHPDILPTAPECGGDAAFADCARRVMDQGYLFCLHDNYQDIYRDSPSWNERFVMKTRDGKLARGGHWAGGMAFLTCSEMALDLAKRPQNLTAVKKLSNANAYFIDTTYAAGLQECFDPQHPLTRSDDIKWKQALSDYARSVFGVFGSECGREWAIPHSDFFEGLTGVSGHAYHDTSLPGKVGATVVPLFDLVYRDCIAMYGKYGYDPNQAARYVLHHISLGRPLNYHSIPAHLYWTQPEAEDNALDLSPSIAEVTPAGPRQFKVTYRWKVGKPASEQWRIFVHFTDDSGNIKFQNDQQPSPAIAEWKAGEVLQGPFTVTVPDALSGTFQIRMGLYQPDTGRRAVLQGKRGRDRGYLVGKIVVKEQNVEFLPTEIAKPGAEGLDLFTRAENGWAAGMHPMDRFIKNTYEVLSPLNELTARMQMTRHEFLTGDRKVERTIFGEGPDQVTVTVNLGEADYLCQAPLRAAVRLPPLGFLVESPSFVAFHAGNWNGRDYGADLPLFTLRSLDEQPLSKSRKVHVFHAFGDDHIRIGRELVSVAKEQTVAGSTQ